MMKLLLILIIVFNYIFSQTEDDIIQIQENSMYWKKGIDKLILKNGEVFYGKFIETKNENIFFKVEFIDEVICADVNNDTGPEGQCIEILLESSNRWSKLIISVGPPQNLTSGMTISITSSSIRLIKLFAP